MNYNFNMSKIYMNKLEAKIKEQRERIDKAIEYLENHTYDKNGECGYTPDWEVRELYDILKGSDEE